MDALTVESDPGPPPISCTESEAVTAVVPDAFEWIRDRPIAVWLDGEAASGSALVWSASNLPPGVALTDTSGVLAGTPTESGQYTVTLTAASASCAEATVTRALSVTVVAECAIEECPPSPACESLRLEKTALTVEYVPGQGARYEIAPGDTLAVDHLLVEAVTLNGPGAKAARTLVMGVPGSKDIVLVHYSLPGGVFAPLTGQVLDLRYVHGDNDDRYLFLTIDHLKRFVLFHNGVLTRDELQRRCPDNPIGLHCQLPEVDWVPLPCEHPVGGGDSVLALETVTAADEGPGVVRRRLGPGQGVVTGGMLLMLVDARRCQDASCSDSPSPIRASYYEVPSECAVCRIAPFESTSLTAPVQGLQFTGEVLHPENAEAGFTWTPEPPVSPWVITREQFGAQLAVDLPMVGDYAVRLDCTAKNDKASLKSCGPAEVRFRVGQRPDRPVRVEFWWLVPTVAEDPEEPPRLTFNGDAAQSQGPRFDVVEPSLFGTLRIEYPAQDGPAIQARVRILVEGEEEAFFVYDLEPGDSVDDLPSLGPTGLEEVGP